MRENAKRAADDPQGRRWWCLRYVSRPTSRFGCAIRAPSRVIAHARPVHVERLVGNTKISIIYGVPDANNYDWTGGPAPYSVTPASAASDAEATWFEQLNTLNEPTPVSATNNSAADLDSPRTFIAGALVGAGGGALVGAIQEATPAPGKRVIFNSYHPSRVGAHADIT